MPTREELETGIRLLTDVQDPNETQTTTLTDLQSQLAALDTPPPVPEPIAVPDAPVAPESFVTPENLITGQQEGTEQFAADIGLDVDVPTSLEEFSAELLAEQGEETTSFERSAEFTAQQAEFQASQFKNQAETALAAAQAALSPGREGVVSAGAAEVFAQLESNVMGQINQAIAAKDETMARINDARDQLADAQAQGREDLARSLEGAIATMEQEIKQLDIDLLETQTIALDSALSAISTMSNIEIAQQSSTRANLDSFQSMIETGATLTAEAIDSFATSLNIDFSAANDFYTGAQAIRDDKTLSNEEKAIQNATLLQDFENLVNNVSTAQAQNLQFYQKLSDSGQYSTAEMSAFARALGFEDANDPKLLADIAKTQGDTEGSDVSIGGGEPTEDPITFQVGDLSVTAQPTFASALQQADAAMFAATGEHIDVRDSLRSSAQQEAIWADSEQGTKFRAAPPGSSFHEKGLAIDVNNWEAAQPFLAEVGIVNGLAGDMGHFSMGEMNPDIFAGEVGDSFNQHLNDFVSKGFPIEDAREMAQEKVDDEVFDKKTVLGQVSQNEIVITTIDEVLTTLEGIDFKTGLIGKGAVIIPGTEAFDLNEQLQTIRANVGFEKLQQMRNASKTGGALGQVSEMENKLLQSVLGSLDIGQSEAQLKDNLNQIRTSLTNINDAAYEDYGIEQAGDTGVISGWRSAADPNVSTGVDDIN